MCSGADCTKPLLSRCTPKPVLALPVPLAAPAPLSLWLQQRCAPSADPIPARHRCYSSSVRSLSGRRGWGSSAGMCSSKGPSAESALARWTGPAGRDVPDPCHKPTLTWLLLKTLTAKNQTACQAPWQVCGYGLKISTIIKHNSEFTLLKHLVIKFITIFLHSFQVEFALIYFIYL